MKPKPPDNAADLFRSQLSQVINQEHRLCRLSRQIDWDVFEQEYGALYATGPGRPGLPTRLMVGLHYLKYLYNESDESVVERWLENPYWQYFCGYEYLQHTLPLHPTSLVKWRQRIGADKLELLLKETVAVAQRSGALKARSLTRVNVDTTVQEKAVAFPTDARLHHKMRVTLVRAAKQRNIPLRQSYHRVGKRALIWQGRYASARQGKRAAKQGRKLKTYLGRVVRDIRRQCPQPDETLHTLLNRAEHLLAQQTKDKNKIYSVHAPEVECIAKGKAHKRYEFGCKASIATTSADNWIVGAMNLPGRPYDGHTLTDALRQVEQLTGRIPAATFVDQGYRGHKHPGDTVVHVVGRFPKTATRSFKRWLKRRAAIEPCIGHLKSDHRMHRNHLKGTQGDAINVVLAAAGYNLAKLLAWIAWLCRILTNSGLNFLGPRFLMSDRPVFG
jgi:IS5 family transposase